ncbi:hypothetical protein H1230_23510 [Paenibacillus sp. 19GGS1-52]|uniref:DUF2161 family putative PD-(D/E)XK-type phosphodiesterase n=1 Tax=Paenibacillus sp. 19GGS1-52 TaxID=2758563 RepID=UPI001EFB6657|nr:DUF2161 family putative PD-(D/E)XK-type phosphodiesterase [Paenibacillus sp. 19GGS1-52]ULO05987.1 hypothetical protein H1230_23510 [Paenibacillus sp. 19GGS1-52]
MAVRHETELYAPLKVFFEQQGYVIKGEVRTCDLVGVRENEEQPLIVEMKKSFNLALLLQGVERLRLSPTVYLAVERVRDKKGAVNQRWGELSGLCRRLGLGLITVTFYKTKPPVVEVLVLPDETLPLQRSGGRRRERLLLEFRERSGDYNTGGSTGVKLVTAYREKALRVALSLQAAEAEARLAALRQQNGVAADPAAPAEAGAAGRAAERRVGRTAMPTSSTAGVTPAELRKRSGVPNAALMLQHNYYGWFSRVARGRYILTAAGAAALIEYAAIAETSAARSEQ